ncbi:hypothetical protein PRIPAC_79449 [Pristionchus pacificus]|nr:hypothetical protein PRIPAC_79449 [Pristionchus pacificus]
MANLSLHPLWLTFMPIYQRSVGLCTHLFSALAFYLILTKTPISSKLFAKYLMLLQASITLVDFNFGLLVCPIALFPIPGGLCNGILCTWFGLTGHAGITIMFFSVAFVGVSIIYCFHFRLVSIGQMLVQDSIEATRHIVFRILLLVVYVIPCALQIGTYRNLEGGSLFVKKNFSSLYYLIANPEYRAFVYDLTLYPEYSLVVASSTVFVSSLKKINFLKICHNKCVQIMILALVLVVYFAISSFLLLSKQSLLSDKTKLIQQQMMKILIIQTLIPMLIQLSPLFIYTYSMIAVALNPNLANAIFCFQLTHAFIHTSILLGTTPSYRESLMFWRRKEESPSASRFTQLRQISHQF